MKLVAITVICGLETKTFCELQNFEEIKSRQTEESTPILQFLVPLTSLPVQDKMIACLFQSSSDYEPTSYCRNLEINYVGDFCKPIIYVLRTKKMLTIAYVLLIAVKLGH